MADSDVDLCSQSLGLLRADSISSLDDGSNEADICSLFYDDFANDVLTRYPWSFCTKKILLVQEDDDPVNEYQYSHIVPGGALRIWALFPDSGVGSAPVKDYEIQADDEGNRRIYSNYSTLYAEYTWRTDESKWPGYFVQFFIHAFAALIAKPVTDQTDLQAEMHQLAWGAPNENEQGGKYGVACKIDAMQKPGEQMQSSPLVEARFS